jgi:hypothetical protein
MTSVIIVKKGLAEAERQSAVRSARNINSGRERPGFAARSPPVLGIFRNSEYLQYSVNGILSESAWYPCSAPNQSLGLRQILNGLGDSDFRQTVVTGAFRAVSRGEALAWTIAALGQKEPLDIAKQ